ncbi:MAG: hypothetical protein MHM6MM_005320 [Cercozoa sp. M6MM]
MVWVRIVSVVVVLCLVVIDADRSAADVVRNVGVRNAEPRSLVLGADIVIGVSSFRDDRCRRTVLDAFEQARNASRLGVVVLEQSIESLDSPCIEWSEICLQNESARPQVCAYQSAVRVFRADAREALGPTWARYRQDMLVLQEFRSLVSEDAFFLQIDAHMAWAPDWDATLVASWLATLDPSAVLSGYPKSVTEMPNYAQEIHRFAPSLSFDERRLLLQKGKNSSSNITKLVNSEERAFDEFSLDEDESHEDLVPEMIVMCVSLPSDSDGGLPVHRDGANFVPVPEFLALPDDHALREFIDTRPLRHLSWGAQFSFSKLERVAQVPYAPWTPVLFFGEEVLMQIRLEAHGYHVYAMSHDAIYHEYAATHPAPKPRFWHYSPSQRKEWQLHSQALVRAFLFGHEVERTAEETELMQLFGADAESVQQYLRMIRATPNEFPLASTCDQVYSGEFDQKKRGFTSFGADVDGVDLDKRADKLLEHTAWLKAKTGVTRLG